jgi:hypothetical protein
MPSRRVRFQPLPFQTSREWYHTVGEVVLRKTASRNPVPGEMRS